MTEFKTQCSKGKYSLQFDTDNEQYYKVIQSCARLYIDDSNEKLKVKGVNSMKLVGVQFRTKNTENYGEKVYVYRTNLELEVGDNVVVETCYGPTTAVVAKIDTPVELVSLAKQRGIAIKFVISKFDTENVEALKRYEQSVAEAKARIKTAYKKKILEQMADELAEEMPELKGEIEQLKANGELEDLFAEME